MYAWAPIAYARTFQVDFRFLVLPRFVRQGSGFECVERYVRGARVNPESLFTTPRWVMFQNDSLRVCGVVCLARDLIGQEDSMTRDFQHRVLFGFWGYAALREKSGRFPRLPPYTEGLTHFTSLYSFVRSRWTEDHPTAPYYLDPTSEWLGERSLARVRVLSDRFLRLRLSTPRFKRSLPRMSSDALRRARIALNEDPDWVAVWRDNVHARAALWENASSSRGIVSVCLGLGSRRDALRGPFMNATVAKLSERSIREHRGH